MKMKLFRKFHMSLKEFESNSESLCYLQQGIPIMLIISFKLLFPLFVEVKLKLSIIKQLLKVGENKNAN